jgi:16S rRNA (adenine1518-N6/adenine1519-N6)-dimethyltransferase
MTHPKEILSRYGIDPKKSLGQNFLVDYSIITAIAEAALLTDLDEVLEVGSGLGDLTRLLASTSKRVVGIEIDGRLIPILEARLVGWQNVQIIQENILDVVPGEIFQGNYKVVGNLPYYITGQLLKKFLSFEIRPSLLLLTVQKEVAQRITAGPGKMSLLALIVQFYAKVKLVRTIKAGSFWPRPNVDSAVIRLEVFETLPLSINDEARFIKLAKVGFSHKRKQLQKNLRQLGFSNSELISILSRAGIDGTRRAESLSIEEWLLLYQTLY